MAKVFGIVEPWILRFTFHYIMKWKWCNVWEFLSKYSHFPKLFLTFQVIATFLTNVNIFDFWMWKAIIYWDIGMCPIFRNSKWKQQIHKCIRKFKAINFKHDNHEWLTSYFHESNEVGHNDCRHQNFEFTSLLQTVIIGEGSGKSTLP